jgi:DNA invertase Pin-like site-specific DNA recombinase
MGELKAKGVDLHLHQQHLDTVTPPGKAMFQMLGVFSRPRPRRAANDSRSRRRGDRVKFTEVRFWH